MCVNESNGMRKNNSGENFGNVKENDRFDVTKNNFWDNSNDVLLQTANGKAARVGENDFHSVRLLFEMISTNIHK